MKKSDDEIPTEKSITNYINRTRTLSIYKANIAFSIDGKGSLDIIKNRFGETKTNLSLTETVDLCSDIIAKIRFKGITKVFEAGMKYELEESIKKIIDKYKGGEEL